jgi:hypothetical protein
MPKAGRKYGPSAYSSLRVAYDAYQKHRFADTPNPALASREKFATIWGWSKSTTGASLAKKVARPA